MAKRRWIDLSRYGIYVCDQKMSNGKYHVVVLDLENRGDPAKLRSQGFVPLSGSPRYEAGIYYLEGEEQRWRPKAFASAFGIEACPLVEVESREIEREFRKRIIEKCGANINAVILRSRLLGRNRAGQPVYESSTGRFVRTAVDKAITEHQAPTQSKGTFLIASTDEDLRACADGFLWPIRQGQKTNWMDVTRFAKVIYRTIAPTHRQLHQLQEAIEAAASRRMSAAAKQPDSQAFRLALDLYYGLPVARIRTSETVALQQYSTPLPMSVIAQRLLVGTDSVAGKTVLEPTAGNGALVNLLPPEMRIFGVDLDRERHAVLSSIARMTAVLGDATTIDFSRAFNVERFDYTIANPPFGEMEYPAKFDKLPAVRKLDHYIPLRCLEARKPEGRSVVIFGADSARSDGTVQGSAKAVLAYICDHYEVHGIAEVDGRLYSRQGSAFNVRIMVVGRMREAPLQAEVPHKLPLITTYEELWQWSEELVASYPTESLEDVIESVEPPASEHPAEMPPPIPAEPMALPERHVNEFQIPYQPASRAGLPSAMVPINMASATYSALNDLESEVGGVDDFVAQKLGYAVAELPKYFSPEQVDALGLAIQSVESGRGIINADQTGMGKGRFVAAMLRYAKLSGKLPIFLTLKPELFTDIFRDMDDIGSTHLFKRLFIFNDGEDVKKFGTEDQVLYPPTSPQERLLALSTGTAPAGVDMVLATYSQFQRAQEKNPKAALLRALAADNAMLLLDESHIASGASNIAAAVGEAVAASSAVLYASATPLKGVTNFSIYNKVFPPSVDLETLPETLQAGGETLQEAISTNMARDGVLVRREHDFSKLTFHARLPHVEQMERNYALANSLAEILATMSYLSGDVTRMVSEINRTYRREWESVPESERRGSRMGASSMSFGSRLYSLNRQFLLAIKVEEAVAASLEALSNGRKPVVAVENTGESLLRQVISRRANIEHLEIELAEMEEAGNTTDVQKKRREELGAAIKQALREVVLDEPPQFRELLEIMLDRVGTITIQGRYGEVVRQRPDSREYLAAEEELRARIRAFPDLSLTPLDVLKHELERHGYSTTEVSGRKVSLARLDDGRWKVQFHEKPDAVANVAGFQSGRHDAIVITRAGSTGISLHATDRFANSDVRQRDFIVLQRAANIAEFLQWMGRVNRKDQVVAPIITSLESGLPAELRLTMMHNAKLRKLSANTTSNRENVNTDREDLDLLNGVGDRVAFDWLSHNIDTAEMLDIQLPNQPYEVLQVSHHPYINKLMGRLMMVSVERQQDVLSALSQRFSERIEELEHRGENPFRVKVFDWRAKVIREEELDALNLHPGDSSFDDPVKLVTLHFTEEFEPIRTAKVQSLVSLGEDAVKERHQFENVAEGLRLLARRLTSEKGKWIRRHLPQRMQDSATPLAELLDTKDAKAASAIEARSRANWLIEHIESFRPGFALSFDDPYKGELTGLLVAIQLPIDREEQFLLGKYRGRLAVPGEKGLREVSLATVRSQGKQRPFQALTQTAAREGLLSLFDEAPAGVVSSTRLVLQGNIFRACELATSRCMGSTILYSDESGNRQRAVLLKPRVTAASIKQLPLALDAPQLVAYVETYLNARPSNHSSRPDTLRVFNHSVQNMERGDGIIIEVTRGGALTLSMPGTKARSGYLMTDGDIFDIGERTPADSLRLKLAGTRDCMVSKFEREALSELLHRLQRARHVGKFYVSAPDPEIVQELKKLPRVERGLHPPTEEAALAP